MPKTATVEQVKKKPASGAGKVDVRELLKAGAHFGHKTSHWNPKMKPFIHSERGGIYIIDLIQTAEHLQKALDFLDETAASGKQVLFVGTKRHMRDSVKAAAIEADMPYVNERWFGGMLTNFDTMSARVKHLLKCEEQLAAGDQGDPMSKKDIGELKEEVAKLNIAFGGIKNMKDQPGALFVADCITNKIAVREANRLGIPVVGVVDTNSDPEGLDFPVPANDDAVATVALISNLVAGAVKAGKAKYKPAPEVAPVQKKVVAKKPVAAEPKPAEAKAESKNAN